MPGLGYPWHGFGSNAKPIVIPNQNSPYAVPDRNKQAELDFFKSALLSSDALKNAPASASSALEQGREGGWESFLRAWESSAMKVESESTDAANRLQNELIEKQFAFNAEEARKNRLFQQSSAREAMDFSARQAATQWQRAVKDMRQAGINPIYAFQAGGNSSASGVAASGSAASGSLATSHRAQVAQAKAADLEPFRVILSSISSILSGLADLGDIKSLIPVKTNPIGFRPR